MYLVCSVRPHAWSSISEFFATNPRCHGYTHKNLASCIASLPTSRRQVVFALLVPSCQQVRNKLLTTCNNLVDISGLVARLFQQVRYSHDIIRPYNSIFTSLCRQPCKILVISWLYQTCWNNLVTSLIMPSSLPLQVVHNLFQTCYNNWEQAVRTQLVDKQCMHVYTRINLTAYRQDVFALLVPSCWQVWNKLSSSCNKVNEANRLATSCSNKSDIVCT